MRIKGACCKITGMFRKLFYVKRCRVIKTLIDEIYQKVKISVWDSFEVLTVAEASWNSKKWRIAGVNRKEELKILAKL